MPCVLITSFIFHIPKLIPLVVLVFKRSNPLFLKLYALISCQLVALIVTSPTTPQVITSRLLLTSHWEFYVFVLSIIVLYGFNFVLPL